MYTYWVAGMAPPDCRPRLEACCYRGSRRGLTRCSYAQNFRSRPTMRDVPAWALLVLGTSASVFAQTRGPAPPAATLDATVTLSVPAFSLPSSELVSQEFRDAYERVVGSVCPTPPGNDAPRE